MFLLLFLLMFDLLDSTLSANCMEIPIRKGLRFGKRDELAQKSHPCIEQLARRSDPTLLAPKMAEYLDRDQAEDSSEISDLTLLRKVVQAEQTNKLNDLLLRVYSIAKNKNPY